MFIDQCSPYLPLQITLLLGLMLISKLISRTHVYRALTLVKAMCVCSGTWRTECRIYLAIGRIVYSTRSAKSLAKYLRLQQEICWSIFKLSLVRVKFLG